MNKYRVWISQINQTHIDVKARTLDSAIVAAERKWQDENRPRVTYVEKQEGSLGFYEEVWPHKESGD